MTWVIDEFARRDQEQHQAGALFLRILLGTGEQLKTMGQIALGDPEPCLADASSVGCLFEAVGVIPGGDALRRLRSRISLGDNGTWAKPLPASWG